MSKEDVLKVQTSVLNVNIHCDGCVKKVKKILYKIDGVYQSSIDAEEGRVTVSGLVDPETIVEKLNRAGKPAALWGAKPSVVSQPQKLQLGGGGKGQPKDAGGKGQPKDDDFYDNTKMMMKTMAMQPGGGGGKNAGAGDNGGKKGSGGNEIPMLIKGNANNGGGGGNADKRGGDGEIPVQIKWNANNGGGGKQHQGGGQPSQNSKGGAPVGGNQLGQGKKGGGSGPMVGSAPAAGGPMGSMPPQQSTMRPNMMGGAGFPGMGQMGGRSIGIPMGQHPHMSRLPQVGDGAVNGMPAGGMPGAVFYHGSGGGGGMQSRLEMLQAAAAVGNPMAQQQYMAMVQQQQQQQQQMMMGGHGHHGHHGHGGAGYPPMGYGYGHGRPPMPYPMAYPMPPPSHAESSYNIFNDENPNSCSVM